jgi:hypothetical protein
VKSENKLVCILTRCRHYKAGDVSSITGFSFFWFMYNFS